MSAPCFLCGTAGSCNHRNVPPPMPIPQERAEDGRRLPKQKPKSDWGME